MTVTSGLLTVFCAYFIIRDYNSAIAAQDFGERAFYTIFLALAIFLTHYNGRMFIRGINNWNGS